MWNCFLVPEACRGTFIAIYFPFYFFLLHHHLFGASAHICKNDCRYYYCYYYDSLLLTGKAVNNTLWCLALFFEGTSSSRFFDALHSNLRPMQKRDFSQVVINICHAEGGCQWLDFWCPFNPHTLSLTSSDKICWCSKRRRRRRIVHI